MTTVATTVAKRKRRHFFAHEVVQTSKMDCGPAALKCLLEGFDVPIGYGRLREACQTDIDGTSIDVIEDVAMQLGLDAEQQVVPVDHLVLPKSSVLPALVVVSVPATGSHHFVVVWRRHGPLFQVMDPSVGRRWLTRNQLLRDLDRHTMRLPAAAVREWAGSAKFLEPLGQRLARLRLPASACHRLIAAACADATCQRLGALDAATRLVDHLVSSGALPRGAGLESLLAKLASSNKEAGAVPETFWSFWPAEASPDSEEDEAFLRGAVLVTFQRPDARSGSENVREALTDLRPELSRALRERIESPWTVLLRFLRKDGLLAPAVVVAALFVSAAAVGAQALVLRGVLELGRLLGTGAQRLGAMATILVLAIAILFASGAASAGLLWIGRQLENRLRVAFLEKIPRIGDQFFQSRLVSDMAERAHALAGLRGLPKLGFGLLGIAFQLLFTIAGIIWHRPSSATAVLTVSAAVLVAGWFSQTLMTERDLRVRTHNAALGGFYFDALMGIWCLLAHGGGRALLREQEAQLVQWGDAQVRLQRLAVLIEGVQTAAGYGLAVWLLFGLQPGQEGYALLLAYWALQLPMLGQALVVLARQVPTQRNVAERLVELVSTPEEGRVAEAHRELAVAANTHGPHLSLRDVTVRAGGTALLEHLNLEVAAGSHVAIVGESGAGKTTLLGLLLGWHRPASGEILVEGRPLTDEALGKLRRQTAWVDPAVQLWNQRFIDNLTYSVGAAAASTNDIGWAVEAANLREVLERLPEGLQTPLGEGGALISGGEGQRVRLARAMMQRDVRLAILDEPFRGLDRTQRTELLRQARALWSGATLLCATHDVTETLHFDRVLVVGSGRVLEDGNPARLAASSESLYARLLAAEQSVRAGLWADPSWRRIRIERGNLTERMPTEPLQPAMAVAMARAVPRALQGLVELTLAASPPKVSCQRAVNDARAIDGAPRAADG